MLWRYVEKKVKNSLYPDLYYWPQYVPRFTRRSIYSKYGLNIRFEVIPEFWCPLKYKLYFGLEKGYYYPTDDDIKFFYFTLFKKNGFLFILFCCIIYRNCFLEFIELVIKSGIAFYLIVSLIYLILFIRKHLIDSIRFLKKAPINSYPTVFIMVINFYLNIIFNTKKKWYF